MQTAGEAGDAGGRFANRPVPTTPGISLPFALLLQRLLRPNRLWYALAVRIEATPWAYRVFTSTEKRVKAGIFGCRMCAQCALPSTAYACPMSCPKELRNGPCGGVAANGDCEVYPGLPCVWVVAYERAAGAGRTSDLRRLQRPIDQREWGKKFVGELLAAPRRGALECRHVVCSLASAASDARRVRSRVRL